MPRPVPYAPLHRDTTPDPTPDTTADTTTGTAPGPRRPRRLRRTAALAGLAIAATGLVVSSGIALPSSSGTSAAASAAPVHSRSVAVAVEASPAARAAAQLAADAVTGRHATTLSRSATRTAVRPVKKRSARPAARPAAHRAKPSPRPAVHHVKRAPHRRHAHVHTRARIQHVTSGDPRTIARGMLAGFGFGSDQFSCLDQIYVSESGWNVHADNPTSDAYGIPQALPGSKMASAGPNWQNDAATQIRWGLGYIKARYGTPCSALAFRQGHGWY